MSRPEPHFFSSGPERLWGVWRAPQNPSRVWIICPPFAEEEKSAHRTLAEICERLAVRGDASLHFALRGTGDSSGEFSQATLDAWRDDIRAACDAARTRFPDAELYLLGLRLGASLAAQLANQTGAKQLILLEPVLQGKTVLSALSQRKKLRAAMTQHEAAAQPESGQQPNHVSTHMAHDIEDFDGWPLGETLRRDLQNLDLENDCPPLPPQTQIIQIGPRENLSPAYTRWAEKTGATPHALRLKPFWNLLDYERADALFQLLEI
jgi:alpha/beta superfamily hydrolase